MMRFRAISIVAVGVLILGLASVALGMREQARPLQPPEQAVGGIPTSGPFLMFQAGDTTWVQVYTETTRCNGGGNVGRGGEGTGGPVGQNTWCVEGGVGDSVGTNPPWDTKGFLYKDVRSQASQTGVNYWHIDSYLGTNLSLGGTPLYVGTRALWCGASSVWNGKPTECGTWLNPPGYGNQWHCVVQLSLPSSFSVANGCTLYFDPRYDMECKYDYYFVDYLAGTTWKNLALFNSTSNDPGGPCGGTSVPNPDNWGNTDLNRLTTCNWQPRITLGVPAFKGIITAAMLTPTVNAPKLRWRFTSDGAWSDMDGRGNTDGAAFLDNVKVYGNAGSFYAQDFETSAVFGALPQYWTLEDAPKIAQAWHIKRDPDPPYEGGDGGARTTCTLDSSWVWRSRPEKGYPSGVAWRNGWYYRLLSPKIPVMNTGAVWQYDNFMCAWDYTCDYTNTQVRFYDGVNDSWCPWNDIDKYILYGGCFFWNFDRNENVTTFYGSSADSMQFCWDQMDNSSLGDVCRGKHKDTDNIVDNVSVGFFDGSASVFSARGIDILQDSFLEEVAQAYNSFFDAYSPDTINRYSGATPAPLPHGTQMYLNVTDKNLLSSVQIVGSKDKGATWVSRSMTLHVPAEPGNPLLGGEFYGTLKASDFFPGATSWPVGTMIWYYIKATDALANIGYFPVRANPTNPDRDGTEHDYFHFGILPFLSPSYTGPKILLVDGHNRSLYDWSPCVSDLDNLHPLEDYYEQTLQDAGYCFDKFDISGAGSNAHIHPIWFSDYAAVVWFTGPYFSNYLFDKEAQVALRTYLNNRGKVVLMGDRIAYNMGPVVGEDSLGGEFLGGIMGTTYQEEMESGFTKPYVYMKPPATVSVFGTPTAIPLDSILIYRECPYLKDMSYVLTKTPPLAGYTAQQFLDVLNVGGTYPHADGATYVEYQGKGQCVSVNFDLCSMINHTTGYCNGTAASPAPSFQAGVYEGQVQFMKAILYNIFGLPGGSGAGVVQPKTTTYVWGLAQNSPNPVVAATEIRFEVASASDVSIKVYNAMGQLVKVLKDGRTEPGRYSIGWDGRNQIGERVSSGVYFYKMEAGKFAATKKMLLVK